MSQQYHYSSNNPYQDPYRRVSSTQQPSYNYSNTQRQSIPIRPAPPPSYGYPTSPTTSSPSSSYSSSPTSSSYQKCQPPAGSPSYFCLWPDCTYAGNRNAELQRHYRNVHNRESAQLVDCMVPGCNRKGSYGFTRKDKMVDHMRDVHKVDIPKKGGGRRDG